jgi:Putative Ig domain.
MAFAITINAINDVPEISEIPDQTILEDTLSNAISFNITDVETHADDLTVTVFVSDSSRVNPDNIAVNGTGQSRSLTISPTANEYGQVSITIAISDNSVTSTRNFVLTITPVNDQHIISQIPNLEMDEDTQDSLNFTITDIETTACDLTLTIHSSNAITIASSILSYTCAADTYYLSIVPESNQFGTTTITITATDSEGLTAIESFALTITNINDAPTVANGLSDQNTNEDDLYSFTFDLNTFNDVDLGDSLSYTATLDNDAQLPAWLTFDDLNRTFTGTPLNDAVGIYQIKVTATDQSLARFSDTFCIDSQ